MKHIKLFEQLNNIDININDDNYSLEKETAAVKDFKYIPKTGVTVVEVEANIKDDYNTYVYLELSNGDFVKYKLEEKRSPTPKSTKTPPFIEASFNINNKFELDGFEFMDKYIGGSNTIIGAVLKAYSDWKDGIYK